MGTEVDPCRLGRGLDEGGVVQHGDGDVLTVEVEAEGRWDAAEIGLDDFEAAGAIEVRTRVGASRG